MNINAVKALDYFQHQMYNVLKVNYTLLRSNGKLKPVFEFILEE